MEQAQFVDITMTCIQCLEPFMFEANEQKYYYARNLRSPKRCPACRERRRITVNPPPPGEEITPRGSPDPLTVDIIGGTYTGTWSGGGS